MHLYLEYMTVTIAMTTPTTTIETFALSTVEIPLPHNNGSLLAASTNKTYFHVILGIQ